MSISWELMLSHYAGAEIWHRPVRMVDWTKRLWWAPDSFISRLHTKRRLTYNASPITSEGLIASTFSSCRDIQMRVTSTRAWGKLQALFGSDFFSLWAPSYAKRRERKLMRCPFFSFAQHFCLLGLLHHIIMYIYSSAASLFVFGILNRGLNHAEDSATSLKVPAQDILDAHSRFRITKVVGVLAAGIAQVSISNHILLLVYSRNSG